MFRLLQGCPFTFPVKGVKSRMNFCLECYTNMLEILTKNRAPLGKFSHFKFFRCPKTKFEAKKTKQGNSFIIDVLKILLGLKIHPGTMAGIIRSRVFNTTYSLPYKNL